MGQVLDASALATTIQQLKQSGKTVVSTNGCFDILHLGHLRYLQAARQLGDCLVVYLNTDASVQRLKGPERPIVPQDERAELLAGLGCVDYVVLFDEPTPENLLRQIKPDIHVKGAQYNLDNLPEAKTLADIGARAEFLPMVEGRSTTNIIEKIQSLSAASQCSVGG